MNKVIKHIWNYFPYVGLLIVGYLFMMKVPSHGPTIAMGAMCYLRGLAAIIAETNDKLKGK